VAHDLTPSEALHLGRGPVAAFLLETGGQTSHTAIIARALQLPLVIGLHELTQLVVDDDPVIVDALAGEVILHPSAAQLEHFALKLEKVRVANQALAATRDLPAITQDGKVINLQANIELPEELDDVGNLGAAGIGLYRSEFLYIEKSPTLPSEEDHYQLYRAMLKAVKPHPVVVRTFDLGGRKLAKEVLKTEEDNPVLGLRGIRLTLARPDIFLTQIRALLRAGVDGDLRIMLPMISTVDEVRQFRSLIAEAASQLTDEGVTQADCFKLGIMIEVPAAAIIADSLAAEVDFFSIGTNDLIQYALAVDRNNEHVSYLYQPLHPAILRMVDSIVRSADSSGIEVSLCGEMASDPECVLLLLGLGLKRLSLSPRAIPAVKEQIRKHSVTKLARLSQASLRLATAEEVKEELARFLATEGRT
jgi:phosphotransferase system enzyme I (PtsI)